MLKPKLNVEEHASILLLLFKFVGWTVILLGSAALAVFRFGRSCARRIPQRTRRSSGL